MIWHLEIIFRFPLAYCGSQNNGPNKMPTLLSLKPVIITLCGQSDFANVI